MNAKPKRYQNQGCLHFITFSCFQRRPLLDSAQSREIFENELERVRQWYGCFITGYVAMPEHVHLLISKPERSQLSVVMQNAQADHVAQTAAFRAAAFLAGSLLRFSGLE
jgi:REP element-mobilizing transposase RayT